MSRLTPCFRCGRSRGSHFTYDGHDDLDHAFVEPAPQPPADAATKLEFNRSTESPQPPILGDNHIAPALGAAAPPVSGDGDEEPPEPHQWQPNNGSGCKQCGRYAYHMVHDALYAKAYAAGLERGRALGARNCGHDLATIATDAHGMGQENVMSNVMDWLLEEGADDLVRKLETGEWHKVAMNARRSGG